jgi:hypothetical protein
MNRRFAVILMAMLAIAGLHGPLLGAHEGHAHNVMGTVKAVQNGQIDVQDKAGKTTTFKLTPATKILRGKIAAAVGDIKIGERVVVIGVSEAKPAGASAATQPGAAPAGMMTAREVRLAPADAKVGSTQ